MNEIISKQEIEELMKIEGKVRGLPFKTEAEFIQKEEGEEGLKRLEDAMKNIGYPLKYKEMRAMDFYPIGLLAVHLVVIKRLFNYDDKKFEEMGILLQGFL